MAEEEERSQWLDEGHHSHSPNEEEEEGETRGGGFGVRGIACEGVAYFDEALEAAAAAAAVDAYERRRRTERVAAAIARMGATNPNLATPQHQHVPEGRGTPLDITASLVGSEATAASAGGSDGDANNAKAVARFAAYAESGYSAGRVLWGDGNASALSASFVAVSGNGGGGGGASSCSPLASSDLTAVDDYRQYYLKGGSHDEVAARRLRSIRANETAALLKGAAGGARVLRVGRPATASAMALLSPGRQRKGQPSNGK